MAWVYILRGATGRHYIGATDDLNRRLSEHQRGNVATTKRLGANLELAASKQFGSMPEAFAMERKLKAKKNPKVAIYILIAGSDS